jgi:uncharacterized protein (TIGR00299 family) protein
LAIDVDLAGCAGDMLISGIIGLFESQESILSDISDVYSGILGSTVNLTIAEKKYNDMRGLHLTIDKVVQLSYDQILELLPKFGSSLKMSLEFQSFCEETFKLILESERKVHGVEEVHLHELGTSDTIIDIVTTFYLIERLNISSILLSPVATGTGTIDTSHGILNVPTPVTQSIFETSNLVTCTGPLNGEATTPTGAAILSIIKNNFQIPRNVVWEQTSLGFGTRKWDDRGNFLRVRLGTKAKTYSKISVLETNLDDVTPEILGHAISQLMADGALDVSYYPITMKKNRPSYALKVICLLEDETRIADQVMRLTGTLGIRINTVDRHIGTRKIKTVKVKIKNQEFQLNIKIGKYRSKVEFDDIIRIANQLHLAPQEVQLIIERMIENE